MSPQRIQRKRAKDPRPGTDRPCYFCQKRRARPGQNGFCSAECRFRSTLIVKDQCWIWQGWRDGKGYGRVMANGKKYLAHRFAYELWVGRLLEGMEIDHLCRVTSCVRPDHLEQVTPDEHYRRTNHGAYQRNKTHCPAGHAYTPENTRVSQGRRHCRACGSPGWGLKGTRNGHAKLTEEIVAEARAKRASGERVIDLAAHYGVAQSVMSRALTGVTWSHVS